jgi:hypothetical protein
MKRPPRTSGIGPTRASDAVAAALAFRGIADQVRAGRVVTEWSELVGPKIAQRTRPDGITDRTLWVEVATSDWLRELNLLRPQLLKGLIDALAARPGDPPLFDDLKFRLAGGYRREPVAVRAARKPAPTAALPPRPATGVARDRIVREAGTVDDDELRELIARVRITHDR